MATEPTDDLDRQLKELERDKGREELRQLKASAKVSWVTPAFLLALLPLLGGLALWTIGEVKQYSAAYRALHERDQLEQEKQALLAQKNSLNIEIATLLQLKEHYAAQAKQLRQDVEGKQEAIDRAYLRAVSTNFEIMYALGHVGRGTGPEKKALDAIRAGLDGLPKESKAATEELLRHHDLAAEIVRTSESTAKSYGEALKLIPASDWARKLQAHPTGYFLPKREIMSGRFDDGVRYYDAALGRFLTQEEAKAIR